MVDDSPVLRASSVWFGYGAVDALRDVSMHVGAREIVGVLGANGAGKTTLLSCLAGVLKGPSRGRIEYLGEDITRLDAARVVEKRLVMVPEGRGTFGSLTVRENLLIGAYCRSDKEQIQQDADALLGAFPSLAKRADKRAGVLSGGEQQMLAIARGLMSRPTCLMLDEPSLGLAPQLVRQVFDRIARLREEGTTILIAEQNAEQTMRLADRLYVLQEGRVSVDGMPTAEVDRRELLSAYLGNDGRQEQSDGAP